MQKADGAHMAATSDEQERGCECGHDADHPADDQATGRSTPAGVVRAITIPKAAACGALLSGLVAFLQGLAGLAGFGVKLQRVGFFANGAIEAGFAGRSVLALALITLLIAAAGALAWTAGALVWNRSVVAQSSRMRDRPFGQVSRWLAKIWSIRR